MQDGQFYITLPSNTIASGGSYSKDDGGLLNGDAVLEFTKPNEQSDYRVRLPYKVVLDGNWEVALCELQYPHSWYNIDGGTESSSILITMRSQEEWDYSVEVDRVTTTNRGLVVENAAITTHNNQLTEGQEKLPLLPLLEMPPPPNPAIRPVYIATVPPGYYDTREQFVKVVATAVNEAFTTTDAKHRIKVEYDAIHRRVCLTIPSVVYSLTVGQKLQYMLGLSSGHIATDLSKSQTIVKSQSPIDLRGGFDSMYVYCDIVEPQIVGDCLTPLLRVVNVEGSHDDVLVKSFDFPHYVPVSKRELSTIEINIKDDANRFVGFRYGKVVVKLHFRKRKAVF